jgi:hypothetical protein
MFGLLAIEVFLVSVLFIPNPEFWSNNFRCTSFVLDKSTVSYGHLLVVMWPNFILPRSRELLFYVEADVMLILSSLMWDAGPFILQLWTTLAFYDLPVQIWACTLVSCLVCPVDLPFMDGFSILILPLL